MQVKKIEKKYRVNAYDYIRYQLIEKVYFIDKKEISNEDIEYLIFINQHGRTAINDFCKIMAKKLYPNTPPEEVFIKIQVVRNRLNKLCKDKYLFKGKDSRKYIDLMPEYKIEYKGNILYNFNLLKVEVDKS